MSFRQAAASRTSSVEPSTCADASCRTTASAQASAQLEAVGAGVVPLDHTLIAANRPSADVVVRLLTRARRALGGSRGAGGAVEWRRGVALRIEWRVGVRLTAGWHSAAPLDEGERVKRQVGATRSQQVEQITSRGHSMCRGRTRGAGAARVAALGSSESSEGSEGSECEGGGLAGDGGRRHLRVRSATSRGGGLLGRVRLLDGLPRPSSRPPPAAGRDRAPSSQTGRVHAIV